MARWGRRWLDDDEESVTKLARWQSGVTARKMVAEDNEEDATIEEEAEDGIGSRDRSASSDTKSDVEQMRGSGIVAWREEERSPERREKLVMLKTSREMPPRWSP